MNDYSYYAQENNVMLVTPNITNSFGIREDNFIVGYAMGGNVALGTAIMHIKRNRYTISDSS